VKDLSYIQNRYNNPSESVASSDYVASIENDAATQSV